MLVQKSSLRYVCALEGGLWVIALGLLVRLALKVKAELCGQEEGEEAVHGAVEMAVGEKDEKSGIVALEHPRSRDGKIEAQVRCLAL